MALILIVDDDAMLRRSLRKLLLAEGYRVNVARNGDEALTAVAAERPNLVLLDLMMIGRNGFSVCSELRKVDALLPIILLTALDGVANRVRGLGLGADDYITKTTDDVELLARIRRALDRSAAYRAVSPNLGEVRLGRYTVDLKARTIRGEDGTRDNLSATDADLLGLLASDRGRFFGNDEIAAALRGAGYAIESATIRSYVSRLRDKLREAGNLIDHERYSGYRLLPYRGGD